MNQTWRDALVSLAGGLAFAGLMVGVIVLAAVVL